MLIDAIYFVDLLLDLYAVRYYRFCVSFGKFQGQISAGYTNNVPLAVSQD